VYLVGLEGHRVLRLLPHNQTINSDKYCFQLDRLKAAIDEKRPELANRKDVVFHQDARSHVTLHTRQKLVQLGWDVLSHPPYSSDLEPSDYHLFRSLQNSLNGKNFDFLKACKKPVLEVHRSERCQVLGMES